MAKILSFLHVVALLMRIAKAMEKANQINERRLELEYPPVPPNTRPVQPRKIAIHHPTVDDWNKKGKYGE